MRRVDRINYCRHPSDAYVDSPQAIGMASNANSPCDLHSSGDGQTISAPHMHAAALEILKPNLKYVHYNIVTHSDLVTGLAPPCSM